MTDRAEIRESLEAIRETEGGILRPSDVVAEAKKKSSPLHECFEWDDRKAGHRYRLWQARELIAVHVTVLDAEEAKPIRAYVSLQDDRQQPGGGYRATVDVLRDAEMRERLLGQALADLKRWQAKYRRLKELEPVFAAAKKVKRNQKRRRKTPRHAPAVKD